MSAPRTQDFKRVQAATRSSSACTIDPAASRASVSALQRPDDARLRKTQLRRKAVLAVVIVGFVGAAAVTRPMFENPAWQAAFAAIGLMAIVAAILGRAWCSLYIGGRKMREIVSRGPYSVCRNPLYLFSLVAAFGVGAQTASLALTTAAVLLTFIVLRQTVHREEAWLRGAFGAQYERYLRATPRFWPRWSMWRDDTQLEIRPSRFVQTVLDGSVLLLILPVTAGLSAVKAAELVPVLMTLP